MKIPNLKFQVNSASLLVIAATLIWGGTVPIMKLTLQEVPIFSLAFTRMFFASLLLGVFVFRKLKIKKSDYSTFLYSALTGVTINLTLFFIALKLTEAILAAVLVAATPVMTMIAANFYLKEKFTLKLVISSAIAFAGVIIIVGIPQDGFNIKALIGNILLLMASLAWVIHEIITKKLLKVYSPETVTFYAMAIGCVTFLPFALLEFVAKPTWPTHLSFWGVIGILYGIFLASFFAYWAWHKGLAKLPAGQASFFFYLGPISGAILSIILLGEKLTIPLIIGSIFITLAVFIAESHRKMHPLHR